MANKELQKLLSKGFGNSAKSNGFLNFTRIVAFISVTLGVVALIVSMSILKGFEKKLFDSAVSFTSHIKVNTFDRQAIKQPEVIIRKLKSNFDDIKETYSVIEKQALVRSGKEINGIILKGIKNSDFKNLLQANIRSAEKDSIFENEIVLGQDLSNLLNAKIGDKILIYSVEGESAMDLMNSNIRQFTVSGIYATGMKQYDEAVAYININDARSLYNMPEGSANIIEVNFNSTNNLNSISGEMDMYLGYPYFTFTVFDLHRSEFSWIELQKKPIPIVLGLISIVAVLNIITTLLIMVVEKTHSIGVLRSMGLSRKEVIRIFVDQGLKISTTGVVAGSFISILFIFLQSKYELIKLKGDIYFLNVLPVEFDIIHFIIVSGLTLIMAYFSTYIPARVAAKIKPIKAIRFS